MATTTLHIDRLHALIGRLLSHHEELAGRPELPPAIARDLHLATCILDEFSQFLECVVEKLPPPDLPETSRSSHYSG